MEPGIALFERVCELDLEGIVAKYKHGRYVADREQKHVIQGATPRIRRCRAGPICSNVTATASRFKAGMHVHTM